MTFAAKLLLGSVSVLLVTASADMLYSFRASKEKLREEFATDSEATAAKIAGILSPMAQNPGEVCRIAKEIFQIYHLENLIINRSSAIVCKFGQDPSSMLGSDLPKNQIDVVERTRVYSTYASVECVGDSCQPYELEIGISFSRLDAALAMLWNNQLRNTLVLVFSTALFLTIFSIFVRRRLEKLAEACTKIQGGNLDINLNVGGSDEISRVAHSMNKMARDLRIAAEEKERQSLLINQTMKMSALGEMAGGMAHEINNPLAIIQMTASQLEGVVQEDPVDKELATTMVASIIKTSERISKIIIGLRAFSREGKNDPFSPIQVSTLIEDTIVLCKDRFAHHEVDLQIESFDKSITFEARSSQISQVLLNLLNNAHDAVLDSDQRKWVKISVAADQNFVEIRVTDCKKGISPEIQKKIFQPFFTTKEVGKGTGMGLSISLGIIKAHNGELRVDTQCENTCFLMKLPLNHAANSLSA